jgi:outer membrane lipoprotein-sorting protein
MKKLAVVLISALICNNITAQSYKKLLNNEKQQFEQKLLDMSKKMKTLQCSFVQEKTSVLLNEKSVSKGIMLYKSANCLRWEYTEPNKAILILNGKNATLTDGNGKKLGNERMLKQLGELIVCMINGEGMKDSKQFSAEFCEFDKNTILMVLKPMQKRLKEFYASFQLKIDKNTMLASEIVMEERTGDKTIITLKDRKLDIEIDDSKFKI